MWKYNLLRTGKLDNVTFLPTLIETDMIIPRNRISLQKSLFYICLMSKSHLINLKKNIKKNPEY